jgi:hypothetical protein
MVIMIRRPGQTIATELPALALNEAAFLQVLHHLLEKLDGEFLLLGNFGHLQQTAPDLGTNSQVDQSPKGILAFLG